MIMKKDATVSCGSHQGLVYRKSVDVACDAEDQLGLEESTIPLMIGAVGRVLIDSGVLTGSIGTHENSDRWLDLQNPGEAPAFAAIQFRLQVAAQRSAAYKRPGFGKSCSPTPTIQT